ncbi:MAG TPA: peptide ligase PGM1-related protein [Pyrinomonadaceae bacterium]|nr:peptide ligase PGM1-related protein [Pyrinomonadaceae bacterium]
MNYDLPVPQLGLTPAQADAEFERLQKKLVPLWKSIQSFNQDEQTIVVVPSLTIDFDCSSSVLQAYEERFLFLLLLLRQPRARLIYVTSQMIQPNIIDYYLDLLPGVIASHARKRLFLVSPHDASTRPLSIKLLERPRLIEYIRSLILDFDRAHMVPYNTTTLERDLAIRLGIPMYGADPKTFPLGTKSGSRRIFVEEGVPHPLGIENLSTVEDVTRAIAEMRVQKPELRQVLVKLNEGVAGEGNALVDLAGLPPAGDSSERNSISDRLRSMKFEDQDANYETYVGKLNKRGGVVEERITGEEFRSPSAQLRVTPLGQVERLSTHDQVLGGASGQTFLGCRFPADQAYASAIMREAAKVGARLAREGVVGRFAIDFVAVRGKDGAWDPYAIEINLRKGGTTHPFLTLQFLTDGAYDADKGIFTTAFGQQKCFVASDHQDSPLYRAFTPDDLFDIVARRNLHFDQTRQTGVVFHMMSALGEAGRVGLTAVDNSPAEAYALFRKAVTTLDEEARLALNQQSGRAAS